MCFEKDMVVTAYCTVLYLATHGSGNDLGAEAVLVLAEGVLPTLTNLTSLDMSGAWLLSPQGCAR